jgi:hypothetical protein
MFTDTIPGIIVTVHLFVTEATRKRKRTYGVALEYIDRARGLPKVYTNAMSQEEASKLTELMLTANPCVEYRPDGWTWHIHEVC